MKAIDLDRYLIIDQDQFILSRRRLMLWSFFGFIYLFSGLLFVSPIPYRMAFISLPFGLLTLLFYRWRINIVTITCIGLVLITLISAIINNSTLFRTLYFIRIPVFAYFTYYTIRMNKTDKIIRQFIYWGRFIGLIQLPIILIQWATYPYWRASTLQFTGIKDSGFGTFYFKTDYTISMFLVFHIIVLLYFGAKTGISARTRLFWIAYFTLSVFIINAQFVALCLLLVFVVYVYQKDAVYRITIPIITIISVLALLTGVLSLSDSPLLQQLPGSVTLALRKFAVIYQQFLQEEYNYTRYLAGFYDRVGAIRFLFFENPRLFGDGPALYDPTFGISRRGNNGHILVMIAEIGFIGALVSIFYYIAVARGLRHKSRSFNVRSAVRLIFLVTFLCGWVYPIMNDIGVLFTFIIFIEYVLLPDQFPSQPDLTAS